MAIMLFCPSQHQACTPDKGFLQLVAGPFGRGQSPDPTGDDALGYAWSYQVCIHLYGSNAAVIYWQFM